MTRRKIIVHDEDFKKNSSNKMTGMDINASIFSANETEFRARDVRQKLNGSCYMLGTLFSIAMNQPEMLHDMITDNNDGTVTVTFWKNVGNNKIPLEVQIDKSLPPVDDQSAPWVRLIEKAYVASGLKPPTMNVSGSDGIGEKFTPDMKNLGWFRDKDFFDSITPYPIRLQYANDKIDSKPSYDAAKKMLEDILRFAEDNNAVVTVGTKKHVMAFQTIVTDKDGNTQFKYYDQYKDKAHTVPFEKLLSPDTDIEVISIRYFNKKSGMIESIDINPAFHARNIKKALQPVTKDSLKDVFCNTFLGCFYDYSPGPNFSKIRNLFITGSEVNKALTAEAAKLGGKITNRELTELFKQPSDYRTQFCDNMLKAFEKDLKKQNDKPEYTDLLDKYKDCSQFVVNYAKTDQMPENPNYRFMNRFMADFKTEFSRLSEELKKTDAFYSKGSKPYQNIRNNIDAWNTQLQRCNNYCEFKQKFHLIMGGSNMFKAEMDNYRKLHADKELDDRMLTRLKLFNRFEMLYNRLENGFFYNSFGLQTKYIEKYVHAKLADTIKNGNPEDANLAQSVLLNPEKFEKRVNVLLKYDEGKSLRDTMPKSEMDLTVVVRINGEKFMKKIDKAIGNNAPSVLPCNKEKNAPTDVIAKNNPTV